METMIEVLLYIVTFFLGASIGSFSLVVVRRGHNNENGSWAKGQSICESCKKTLHWWELIPFVSFLILRGKCSKCKTKIDPSHFFCETSVGIAYTILIWLLLSQKLTLPAFLMMLMAHTILIPLSFSDILYREISSIPVYVLGGVGAIYTAISTGKYYMIAIIAGLFVAFGFIGRKDNFFALGFGDVDVAIAIFALSFSGFAFIDMLIYASLFGIVLAFTLLRKKDTSIPFVPCMYIGYVINACGISVTSAIYDLIAALLTL